jgi:hypothetical protein
MTSTKTAKSSKSKSTVKKQRKVLSQAAQQLLEKERLEAQKTRAQKLSESIKRRNASLAKHDTVAANLEAVEAAAKKEKNIKLAPLKKVRQKAPMKRDSEFEVFQARLKCSSFDLI